jgi:3D (Asp-Asp-Asp) domain-containing protein
MDNKKLVVGLMAVNVLLGVACYKKASFNEEYIDVPVVEEIVETPVVEDFIQPRPESIDDIDVQKFRVTAYCPCEQCCGEWAKKRPLDENGEPIVIGALGVELVDGYSVASPMAFGTQVELDGIGIVEVQDRTAQWVVDRYGENIIDLYMTDHKTASEFGVQYIKGVIK